MTGNANRLANEKSPYLLQHAGNPVDWYPWGEEAFQHAKSEDRPVFLSIGYSTCHWCHVMAHESFEDADLARLMNDTFVCIKVDREERPDIDMIYMRVCQAMTGSGGWPITVLMTPDQEPFFAAGYLTKTGLRELCLRIGKVWETRRSEILEGSSHLVSLLQKATVQDREDVDPALSDRAYSKLAQIYDPVHGGFGTAPKFPMPHNILFLLRRWRRNGDERSLMIADQSLRKLREGGIYDQVGFGIHRYSIDEAWTVPHFEKMLYDQALLAMAYTEAFLATGDPFHRSTAEEIFSYVLYSLHDETGGFHAAEDADTEGVEGGYYLWTSGELQRSLGDEDAHIASVAFQVRAGGNYPDGMAGGTNGKNILRLRAPASTARALDMDPEELSDRLETIRRKLFDARCERPRPAIDDKIITDWNGLMIAALAKGARAFCAPSLLRDAERATEFILTHLRDSSGRLLHSYRNESAHIAANLDDYAFFIWGLIELYEASLDIRHLEIALDLTGDMLDHYLDPDHGGFFFTPDDCEELILRSREISDGALPSGNSVAMYILLRLAAITGDISLEETALEIPRAFSHVISDAPAGHTFLMCALELAGGPSREVVIAGEQNSDDANRMISALGRTYLPEVSLLFRSEEEKGRIAAIAPFTEGMSMEGGHSTAYVCSERTCQHPTTDAGAMLEQLHVRRSPSAG